MNRVQGCELDERLKQLAVKARQYPSLSVERQQTLAQLVRGILTSGRLSRPYQGQFQRVYEDIYDEAKQELLLYICQKIDCYDPEKSPVMRWANFLLEKRFFVEAIPKVIGQKSPQRTLKELEMMNDYGDSPSLAELLKQYIETDPDDLFKKEHIENYPQANFQAIATRLLAGKTWKEISEELGIKIPTLSSFYRRGLQKFKAKLQAYCQEQGN